MFHGVALSLTERCRLLSWNQARVALKDAGDIESFRLVLAHIVFSLTQRPNSPKPEHSTTAADISPGQAGSNMGDVEVEECADLMSRLNLAIDAEEPPVHLEKGVRLIHSLRSRMMMCADTMPLKPRANRRTERSRPAATRFDAAGWRYGRPALLRLESCSTLCSCGDASPGPTGLLQRGQRCLCRRAGRRRRMRRSAISE